MKKIQAYSVGALFAVGSLSAMAGQDGPGCGLGQQVWAGSTGLFAHTSAATTNNSIFYNQLFGITSGTLGCNGDNAVVSNEFEKKQFVASNLDELARDTAQGNGAHLITLANMLGIAAEDQAAFLAVSQANYDRIFSNETHDYQNVLAGFDKALNSDVRLNHYVRKQNV